MELIIFVGLQASGKTSFFRERFAESHEHVSKDLFPNNRNKNRRQVHLIEVALQTGASVVVDNTNPTTEDRRHIIELGHRHGAVLVGYYFKPEVRGCIKRNRRRTGKDRVPEVAIYATAKKLEPPLTERVLANSTGCVCQALLSRWITFDPRPAGWSNMDSKSG